MSKREGRIRISFEVLCALILWSINFCIPYTEYDLTIALMLYAFILSIIFYLGFSVYWIKRKKYLANWIAEAIVYSLICSPLTIGIVVLNIHEFFKIYIIT